MTKYPKKAEALKKRWQGLTEGQRLLIREQQAQRAKYRWSQLTPEERREIGRRISEAKKGKKYVKLSKS